MTEDRDSGDDLVGCRVLRPGLTRWRTMTVARSILLFVPAAVAEIGSA